MKMKMIDFKLFSKGKKKTFFIVFLSMTYYNVILVKLFF